MAGPTSGDVQQSSVHTDLIGVADLGQALSGWMSSWYGAQITAPVLYLTFPGNAREALEFYGSVFGGEVHLHTYAEFSRTDGPADSIAHGVLDGGPVALSGSDAGTGETPMRLEGVLLSLLGTASPDVLHAWFDQLAATGTVIDPLGPKPWGASDGQVQDRFGLCWLIGYEPTTP